MDDAYTLSVNASMSLDAVLKLPVSFSEFFYKSPAWETAKTTRSAKQDEMQALFKGLNEVIKALNARR